MIEDEFIINFELKLLWFYNLVLILSGPCKPVSGHICAADVQITYQK